jgi:hypothetical protein
MTLRCVVSPPSGLLILLAYWSESGENQYCEVRSSARAAVDRRTIEVSIGMSPLRRVVGNPGRPGFLFRWRCLERELGHR